jgi:probable rRNA maturation factor
MTVEVQVASVIRGLPEASAIIDWADAVRKLLGTRTSEVCIRIVDETEGRTLNAQYRQRDQPTNVLSFAADVEVPDLRLLGDIVICAPVVEQEASDQRKLLAHHFAHMVVHGMLHLHGYDHEDDEEAKEMESLEAEVLAGFGIAHPYL